MIDLITIEDVIKYIKGKENHTREIIFTNDLFRDGFPDNIDDLINYLEKLPPKKIIEIDIYKENDDALCNVVQVRIYKYKKKRKKNWEHNFVWRKIVYDNKN